MPGSRDREQPPWLDPQTEAILQATPPETPTAPAAWSSGFTIVLLRKGLEPDRLVRAIERIWCEPERPATPILNASCPIVVHTGLTLEEAVLGQFELICCDCISVFVRDEIVADGSAEYLRELYSQLRTSPEFQPVSITITLVPDTGAGRRFCDQFLSVAASEEIRYGVEIAMRGRVFQKKARMMAYWAMEIGTRVVIGQ
jgi:hypothetical protein